MKSLLLFLPLLATLSPRASANLLVNGSFETPNMTDGNFFWIPPTTTVPGFGWTVTGQTISLGDRPGAAARDGSQWVGLKGVNGAGGVQQDVVTVPFQQYRLTFSYAQNPDEAAFNTVANQLFLSIRNALNDSPILGYSSDPISQTPTTVVTWIDDSLVFTAFSALTRIHFYDADFGDVRDGIFLDRLILEEVADTRESLPEPATLSLTAVAACCLAWRRYRAAGLR